MGLDFFWGGEGCLVVVGYRDEILITSDRLRLGGNFLK